MTGERSGGRRRPAIRPPFVPVVVDPDTIELRIGPWAGPLFTIRDDDGDGRLGDLIRLFDGDHSATDVLEAFEPEDRNEVAGILDRLYDEGVLIDAGEESDDLLGGYVSSNPAFASDDGASLAEPGVLVVNDGPIGRMVVEDIVAIGAENVALYESDRDDARPLRNGTERAISRLGARSDLADGIRRADCVVYTEDAPNPGLVDEVNRLAFDAATPWISGRIHGFDGFVGPAVLPGRTSCYECFRTRAAANVAGSARYRRIETAIGDAPPIPAFSRVIAGYITVDLLHLLIEGTGFTTGRVIHFDFFDLTVESNAVLKLPRCGVCGRSDRSRLDWQRYLDLAQLAAEGR